MHNRENTYHLWAIWKGIQCTEVLKIHLSNNLGLKKSKALTYFSAQTSNSILRFQIKYAMIEGDGKAGNKSIQCIYNIFFRN